MYSINFVLILLLTCFTFATSKKSCVGFCGTNILVENNCMCNDDCIHNNNCCMDFFMACSSNESKNITNIMNNTKIMNITNNSTKIETIHYLRTNLNNEYINEINQQNNNYIFECILYLHLIIVIILYNVYMCLKQT